MGNVQARQDARKSVFTKDQAVEIYGGKFASALEGARSDGEDVLGAERLGARHFLEWITTSDAPAASRLSALLRDPDEYEIGRGQAHGIATAALSTWRDMLLSEGRFRHKTVQHYVDHASSFLAALGNVSNDYPKFGRPSFPASRQSSSVKTLAASDETIDRSLPSTAQERHALDRVLAEATAAFSTEERLYLTGAGLVDGSSAGATAEEEVIRELILHERESWTKTGWSQFSTLGMKNPRIDRILPALTDRRTWLAAGFPEESLRYLQEDVRLNIRLRQVAMLAIGCVGPTLNLTSSAIVAFCCGTGWNRQTIFDLPRDPFVYRTSTQTGILIEAYVESFKKRAGHHVVARLERDGRIDGMSEDSVRKAWSDMVREHDPYSTMDGHALLGSKTSVMDLLDRYQAVTEPSRAFDVGKRRHDHFFFYLSLRSGVGLSANSVSGSEIKGGYSRPGVSFQSIRKTYLNLKVREVGSLEAAMPFAGHRDGSILRKHYLASDDLQRELDESIRFFQNAIQSLVVGEEDGRAIRIGLELDTLAWFRRLADLSCISSACGVMPMAETEETRRNILDFAPTDANLLDLFLAHRALVMSRANMGRRRWMVQGMPLLACVKAIGRTVFSKGLGPAYVAAAKRASDGLRSGAMVLPVVVGE